MTLEEVNTIRQRVLAGEDVPAEVLNNCIAYLRMSRAAAPKTKEPKAKAEKSSVHLDKTKLLADLEGL